VCGALLFDLEQGPIPLTAGYACRLDADEALCAALLESAQSRLTDVHGAREDIQPGNHREARTLKRFCDAVAPRASAPPSLKTKRPVQAVLRKLREGGHREIASVELGPQDEALRIMKVIIPSFVVSGLL
jgi:ribosomal protein S12 methylthiotransferase accessory factor